MFTIWSQALSPWLFVSKPNGLPEELAQRNRHLRAEHYYEARPMHTAAAAHFANRLHGEHSRWTCLFHRLAWKVIRRNDCLPLTVTHLGRPLSLYPNSLSEFGEFVKSIFTRRNDQHCLFKPIDIHTTSVHDLCLERRNF